MGTSREVWGRSALLECLGTLKATGDSLPCCSPQAAVKEEQQVVNVSVVQLYFAQLSALQDAGWCHVLCVIIMTAGMEQPMFGYACLCLAP